MADSINVPPLHSQSAMFSTSLGSTNVRLTKADALSVLGLWFQQLHLSSV